MKTYSIIRKKIISLFYRCSLIAFFFILCLACSSDNSKEEAIDTGTTTTSDIPFGDYPDIPRPSNVGDVGNTESDKQTSIAPLATDFLPAVAGIKGFWTVERQAFNGLDIDGYCVVTMINQIIHSDDMEIHSSEETCALPFQFRSVYYRNRGFRIKERLEELIQNENLEEAATDDVPRAFRPLLVVDGAINSGSTWNMPDIWKSYEGDQLLNVPYSRYACSWDGDNDITNTTIPCFYDELILATVAYNPLSSTVYLKKEQYWEKEGNSEVYVNDEGLQFERTFSRTFTRGSTSAQSQKFAHTTKASLSAGVPVKAVTINAGIEETIEQTFESTITVNEEESVTDSWTVSVAGETTAVFEVWNLIEKYTFVHEDGTVYDDPNYIFDAPSLERRATIATAMVSTTF